MKPRGLCYEYWDPAKRLIVDIEADKPDARFTCGAYRSHLIHLAIYPKQSKGSPLDSEWLEGLLEGHSSLDTWLTPLTNEPGAYTIQKGVKIIFRDAGIQTHNGFPQAHVEGPDRLRES